MKQGWEVKTIDEVCEVINGGTPKTNIKEFWEGNIYWITPAEMGKRSSPYVNDTERKLTEKGLSNSSAKLLPPQSVILSSRAPIGHLVINTVSMAFNQGCKGLLSKEGLNNKYLYYYLYANVDLLNSLGTGATFKELSGAKLKSILIPFPKSIQEQQRIVTILDEAFAAIAQTKANAEQNLKNAKELFESYLQSVFENKGDGWEEKTLKELTTHLGDGLHGTPKYTIDGDYHFINGNNLKDGVIEFKSSTKKVSIEEFNQHKKNLTDRTILVSINGTLGNIAFYNNEKIILGKSACYFNMKENVDKNYIKYVLSSPYFLTYAHKEATGATIKNVS